MSNFQDKKSRKKFFQSKPVLVVLSLLLILFLFDVVKLASKASETKKNKEIAQAKITELQEQKVKLEADIQKLNTEKGIEENIREKFGLAKEGEGMIVIVDDESKSTEENLEKKSGFLEFFKKMFSM